VNITKKVLKGLNQVVTWLLFCLLLLAIYGKVQMIILKQSYTSFFGYAMFQVASNSMEPVLTMDDVILVKENSKFKQDDIISFFHEGVVITHRVVNIDNNKITVKGDANNAIDAPINSDDVIGKVVHVFPKLKVWKQIFTDPKILLFLFLTLVAFDFAFSYKKKDTQKESVDKKAIAKKVEPKAIDEPQKEEIKKDIKEVEELLALTRRIDVDEINNVLAGKSLDKMDKDELEFLKKRLKVLETDVKKKDASLLKEKEELEYTIRLDLREIQKRISSKVHK